VLPCDHCRTETLKGARPDQRRSARQAASSDEIVKTIVPREDPAPSEQVAARPPGENLRRPARRH